MLLRSVRVDNFRAVKSARITLDRTTLLIGENDCGRSSILEAIALALGWNSEECEFQFRPFHVHRAPHLASAPPPSISIVLEFRESDAGEWDGAGFDLLRASLPDAMAPSRRFWLEVTQCGDGETRWMFSATPARSLRNDVPLLVWLRRRMPPLWLTDGMRSAAEVSAGAGRWSGDEAERLAESVSRNYRDVLQGTADDIPAAIDRGSAAARELLLGEAKLRPGDVLPLGDVMEQITGRATAPARVVADPLRSAGTAAEKIGMLLFVGSLLRSGVSRMDKGTDPLVLIENPEAHLHPMTLASISSVIDRIGGQKIVATHSGALLESARLSSIRRLTRHAGIVKEWRVADGVLTADELRRYSYHLRSRRADASFARCWLLVEGETEHWLMGELARVCGYNFESEGVACVEFAQCGLSALLKVARQLGIEWHLLADGDAAGQQYARSAQEIAGPGAHDHISLLREADLENCFWRFGYEEVFRKAAYPGATAGNPPSQTAGPRVVIRRAIDRRSKPYLAVLLLDAVIDRGPDGIPPVLRRAIETCIRAARSGPSGRPSRTPPKPR
jgi:putative ATP-dependent endonuclease of OLD family